MKSTALPVTRKYTLALGLAVIIALFRHRRNLDARAADSLSG